MGLNETITMQNTANKRILIIGIIVAIIVIGLGSLLFRSVTTSTPERDFVGNTGTGENSPPASGLVFLNFDALVAVGVTLDQVNALDTAFQNYPPFSGNTVVALAGDDLRPSAPSTSDPLYRPSISSHILVNHKTTYQIKFYFWSTSKIQLFIFDNTGNTQLYDSGTVTGS